MKAVPIDTLIELTKDHNVSTDKLTAVIKYNAELYAQDCERRFKRAFQRMQADLPVIDEDGTATFKDGRTGTYATNEQIQATVGPILRKHGFALSFSTTYPAGMVRVVGTLDHKDGHSTSSEYEARVDMTGGKSDAQGRGSIVSYGHRYTSIDLLNIVTKGHDNDGAAVEPETQKPEGYRDFENGLRSAAMAGVGVLDAAWEGGSLELREAVPMQLLYDLKVVARTRDTKHV